MNRINNERYQETYYEETLKNGLKVVLWHKPGYEKSYAAMATPLGAFDVRQIDSKGNIVEYPKGLAHFLEHKMFESPHGDVMDEFSKMGANVNAMTTYNMTCYYFQTSGDLMDPLNLLLDFTQSFDIDEASVEKEKEIIVQELNMYQQMSDFRLVKETYAALFEKHPIRDDIGGTADSVNATTLSDLKKCYISNYHPSNMILVIVTGKDPQKILDGIKENQSHKKFPSISSFERKHVRENAEVYKSHVTFEMDVNQPKVNVAYKLKGIFNPKERYKTEFALRYALVAVFSPINPEYQIWLDNEIINDFFGYECDLGEDYGYLMVYTETNKKKEFIELVQKQLANMKQLEISEEVYEQLKRRYFGENIKDLNDFESIALSLIRASFNHSHFFELYELSESIEVKDISKAVNNLDIEHVSIVECLPIQ